MDVSSIINQLPELMSVIQHVFFWTICLFLGGVAWKGFKGYSNWGLNIIGSLISGFLILIGSVLLGSIIPLRIPYLPYALNSLIMTFLLYLILFLLSPRNKSISYSSFKMLLDNFNSLLTEFNRLKKALELKGIAPKKLSSSELDKSLGEALSGRKYKIISRELINDVKKYVVIIKRKKFVVKLDAYSGELLSITPSSIINRFISNKRLFAGSLITLFSLLLLLNGVNEQSINEIKGLLNINNNAVINQSCLSINDSFIIINKGNITINDGLYNVSFNYNNDYYNVFINSSLTTKELSASAVSQLITGSLNFNACDLIINGSLARDLMSVCSIKGGVVCECAPINNYYCKLLSTKLINELITQLNS